MPAAQLKPCPSEPVAKSTKSSRYRTKAEHLTYSTFGGGVIFRILSCKGKGSVMLNRVKISNNDKQCFGVIMTPFSN